MASSRWIVGYALSSVLGMLYGTGFARDLESPALEIAPIMVTASRFEEPLKEALPQTTIITAPEIASSGASNISEVLSRVAGLPTRINLDGSTNATLDLRGYGDTADNNVVILLNGVRLSENEQASARTSMIPLEMIDHIEITQGGNSVLYGDGATSGTINIVTQRRAGDLTHLTAGLASYGGSQSSFFHSMTVGENDFSFFGKQYRSNGYRDNSGVSEQSGGLNWTHELSKGQLGAMIFGSREGDQLPGALPWVYLNAKPQASEVPGYANTNQVTTSMVTLFARQRWDSVDFLIDLSQRIRNNGNDYRYDASSVSSGYNVPGWTLSYGHITSTTNNQSINPRIKFSDLGFTGHQLIVGYDWLSDSKSSDSYKTSSWTPKTPNEIDYSHYLYSYLTKGLYLRDDMVLSDADRLTFGVRREWFSQTDNFFYFSNTSPTPTPSPWLMRGYVTAHELQYTRTLTPAATGFIRLGQSFRLPNVDDNSASAYYDPNTYATIPLAPQVSHDLDLGFRYDAPRYHLELTYFYSDISNEIGYDPAQEGNINYTPTRRTGLVFNQSVSLTDKFKLQSHLNYVDARFVEGTDSGKRVPNAAALTGSVSGRYVFATKHEGALVARLSTDRYASGDFMNSQTRIGGYAVYDLSYTYREKHWSLMASLNNLFDRHYTDTGIYKPTYTVPYTLTVYPNPGRNLSLMGSYSF